MPEHFQNVRSSLPDPSIAENAEEKLDQQSKLKQTQSNKIESPSVIKSVVR